MPLSDVSPTHAWDAEQHILSTARDNKPRCRGPWGFRAASRPDDGGVLLPPAIAS